MAEGDRVHSFYAGQVVGAKFNNYNLRLQAMTRKNANSGVFIHAEYQEES